MPQEQFEVHDTRQQDLVSLLCGASVLQTTCSRTLKQAYRSRHSRQQPTPVLEQVQTMVVGTHGGAWAVRDSCFLTSTCVLLVIKCSNVIPHWCAGAILNGSDPSQILQRGSELLFPITAWEKRTGAGNQWEWRGCMIGDASGLMPLKAQGTTDEDSFLLWYGGGDSLSGAAVVTVKRLH